MGESHELPKGMSSLSPLTPGLVVPPLSFHKHQCLLSSRCTEPVLPSLTNEPGGVSHLRHGAEDPAGSSQSVGKYSTSYTRSS